jgi:hypothetical protein
MKTPPTNVRRASYFRDQIERAESSDVNQFMGRLADSLGDDRSH